MEAYHLLQSLFRNVLFQLTKIEKLLLWFTAFEVHVEDEVELVVVDEDSFIGGSNAVAVLSLKGSLLMHSLLVWVDAIPDIFEDKVLNSPTSPEVAGDEVVLFGELDEVVGKQSLLWDGKEECAEVWLYTLLSCDAFSVEASEEQLLTLESVGNGNSNK